MFVEETEKKTIAHCYNKSHDGEESTRCPGNTICESDVDCGGHCASSNISKCNNGYKCYKNEDCKSNYCHSGYKNGEPMKFCAQRILDNDVQEASDEEFEFEIEDKAMELDTEFELEAGVSAGGELLEACA
eukprot:tig00020965_g16886.t1